MSERIRHTIARVEILPNGRARVLLEDDSELDCLLSVEAKVERRRLSEVTVRALVHVVCP